MTMTYHRSTINRLFCACLGLICACLPTSAVVNAAEHVVVPKTVGATEVLEKVKDEVIEPKNQGTQSDLFVLTAQAAVIQLKPGTENEYILQLKYLETPLTYFTDRPDRVAGTMNVDELLEMWKANKLNTKDNQPNVSVVGYSRFVDKAQIYVFKVMQPVYNEKTRTLTFDGTIIGDNIPSKTKKTILDHTSVYIDDIHWHGNKFIPHERHHHER